MTTNSPLSLPPMPAGVRIHDYLGIWAIEQARGAALWSRVRSMDLAAHVGKRETRNPMTGEILSYAQTIQANGHAIAVIHASGTLMKGESSLEQSASTLILRQDIRKATADESIDGIVLILDSPGGTVSGTSDLADDVRNATQAKPTLALVEDLCASAAYWLASACDRIIATNETALVGSIGTFIGVHDLSKVADKEGIEVLVFATGDLKGAGFPGAPITDAQRAYFQDLTEKTQRSFDAAIREGRGFSAQQLAAVKSGRVWPADEALALNLIDGIARYDDAIREFASTITKRTEGPEAMPDPDTTTTPTAATLSQLEAACPGADAEFLLAQTRAGATVQAAQTTYIETLTARIESRDADLEQLKSTHAEQLAAEREKTADAESKLAQVRGGVDPEDSPQAGREPAATAKPTSLAELVKLSGRN